MNYESNDQKFLQVALFAQEEFRARLQYPRFRNLVNRAAMSSTLENLSYAETVAMLRHRWLVAGGKSFPFTDQAIEQIYAYSQGISFTRWSRTAGYPIRNLRPRLARSRSTRQKAVSHR